MKSFHLPGLRLSSEPFTSPSYRIITPRTGDMSSWNRGGKSRLASGPTADLSHGLRARYEQKSITSSLPTAGVCVRVCVFMSIITTNVKTRPFKDIHLCCFCARRGNETAWLASVSGSCVAAFYQSVWSSPVYPGLMSHTIFIPDFCGRMWPE